MSSCRSFYTTARSLSTYPPASQRTLLLTLDAFGTLFHPRQPVPEQYATVAHEYGLSRTAITPEKIHSAFKEVFRVQARRYPNYGRADVLRGLYGGPRQWWAEVIRNTFARTLAADRKQEDIQLPPGLVETLLDRFAGDEGYALYDDVAPFFARMREVKRSSTRPFVRVVLVVISNSDDRIVPVLKAFGLCVGDLRADQDRSSMAMPGFEERCDLSSKSSVNPGEVESGHDLDLVITSYEAGAEKPNRLIFDVAKRQAQFLAMPHTNYPGPNSDDWVCVHVGDDYEKDYRAALDAGWESYLLPRAEGQQRPDVRSIRSLMDLFGNLGLTL